MLGHSFLDDVGSGEDGQPGNGSVADRGPSPDSEAKRETIARNVGCLQSAEPVESTLIGDRIVEVLRKIIDDNDIAVKSTSGIPPWHSVNHARFMIGIETEFMIRFAASEVAALGSVSDLAALIDRKVTLKLCR